MEARPYEGARGVHAFGRAGAGTFRHEALLYRGIDDFLDRTACFVRAGLAAGEPALVMIPGDKIERLSSTLAGDAERVLFVDMSEVGRNSARIIPAWRGFVTAWLAGGRQGSESGESMWGGGHAAERGECWRRQP